jgi:hypothetical protein
MLRSLERATALIIAVLLLVASSTLIIRYLTPQGESTNSGRWGRVLAHFGTGKRHAGAPSDRPDLRAQSELRLVLQQTGAYPANEAAPIGIRVSGKTAGLAVEIIGLPRGTAISSGRPLGAGAWRIPAADISNAMIHPPRGFTGAINLAVELRLADDTIVGRGSLHLEWTAKAASGQNESAGGMVLLDTAPNGAAATPATTDANAIHGAAPAQRDHEPIERVIRRSQDLMSAGDVGAARTLLQGAADTGDARAALALGATYDPIMLATLQAHSITADVALARDWYKRASDFGSQEAQQRLNLLASRDVGVAIDRVEVARKVEPAVPARDAASVLASAKPKKHVARLPNQLRGLASDPFTPFAVYAAGARVGVDPDGKVRMAIVKQYSWMN